MAIISDGTTDLTFTFTDEDYIPVWDKADKTSAKGTIKSQVAGERFRFNIRMRLTPTQVRSLIDLLNNQSNFYYYTPDETYAALFSNVTFPLKANFSNLSSEWDNRSRYYITLTVESVDYL